MVISCGHGYETKQYTEELDDIDTGNPVANETTVGGLEAPRRRLRPVRRARLPLELDVREREAVRLVLDPQEELATYY